MDAPTSTFLLIFHETSPARYSDLTDEERREALERWKEEGGRVIRSTGDRRK